MKRTLFSLPVGAALLAGIPAQAFWQSRDSNYNVSITSASSYVGPGDVIASAIVWYGVRGYSAAYAATGTGKSINVRRASDNATQDIVILTTGDLDVASYDTFVGTDATASCTLAGTSAVCTGASATIHVGDPVTGAGITNPCRVTVTNGSTTATMSLAGTTTTCGTIAVAATFTFQVAGLLPTIYDQSGNTTRDATQATAGTQQQLLPRNSALGGRPSIFGTNQKAAATIPTTAQPHTWNAVINVTTSGSSGIFGSPLSGDLSEIFITGGPNKIAGFAGSIASVTATDGVAHSATAVMNGASGNLNIDGVSNVVNMGAGSTNTSLTYGGNGVAFTGYLNEGGLWGSAISGANQTALCHQQFVYWGTAISC